MIQSTQGVSKKIRVAGFAKRTPLLEFVGKEDCVSDLRGEKLNALFVQNTLAEFESSRVATFAMLAPTEAGTPHYTLFLESGHCQPDLAVRLDHRLQANPHYAYCRRIGQLGELRLFLIRGDARKSYVNHCATLGQRAGNVKMTALNRRSGWEHVFSGTCIQARTTEVCA